MGPQQKEFHREILRTEQVGVRSPKQKESHREIPRTRQVWADEVGHSVQDEFCVPLLLFYNL